MPWGNVSETVSTDGLHLYGTYRPMEIDKWLNAVATEYVSLRTETTIPMPPSLDVSGIGLFDASQLKTIIASATVPGVDRERGPFSVTRSDLSEVAAYMLLERHYGTKIAYKLVRDRELISLPGRGIDAIGLENDGKLLLVLQEVKFSDEDSAPQAPQVVDTSRDCMRIQHRGHLKEIDKTIKKIWDCARRARDESLQQDLMAAALYLEHNRTDYVALISCCVLVRPDSRHCTGDFGSFKTSPGDFSPARVRFLVWSLPADLDSLLNSWSTAVEAARSAQ